MLTGRLYIDEYDTQFAALNDLCIRVQWYKSRFVSIVHSIMAIDAGTDRSSTDSECYCVTQTDFAEYQLVSTRQWEDVNTL